MGADLFGSFAESTCAALVISTNNLKTDALFQNFDIDCNMFPFVLMAAGIIVSLLTSIVGIYMQTVKENEQIEATLKNQLLISTIILTGVDFLVAYLTLPN
jgi:Na+/H+-translocating membrane pyrophosphatase